MECLHVNRMNSLSVPMPKELLLFHRPDSVEQKGLGETRSNSATFMGVCAPLVSLK